MRHLLAAAALGTLLAGTAHASIISTISPTGALPGQTYATFNTLPLGSAGGTTANSNVTVVYTGTAATVQGNAAGQYAAPVFSNGNGAAFGDANGADTTPYIAVGNGAATLTFTTANTQFGVLWGSPDSYNTLTLYTGANGTGTNIGSVSGTDINNLGVNSSGSAYVNITASQAFLSAVFSSTQAAFEFDDVAFGNPANAVPEPISLALLGTGLVGLAAIRRRK